jgi:hypothetical protein
LQTKIKSQLDFTAVFQKNMDKKGLCPYNNLICPDGVLLLGTLSRQNYVNVRYLQLYSGTNQTKGLSIIQIVELNTQARNISRCCGRMT